jgi:hypothetical protein
VLEIRLLLRVDALNHLLQVGAQGFEGLLQFGVGALLGFACAVVVAVVVAALVALAARLFADAFGVLDGSAGGWLPLRREPPLSR